MDNIYNKSDVMKFFEHLNVKLSGRKGMLKSSFHIITNDDLEKILTIVKVHANFCLHAYSHEGISGFSIYNLNSEIKDSMRTPVLELQSKFLNPVYIRLLNNAAMESGNLVKTDVADLNTRKNFYTENGMPKSYRGMKLLI